MKEKIKIAIITDTLPFPLKSGGKVCTFNFIDELRHIYDFTLIFPSWSDEIEINKKQLQALWPEVQILNCDIRSEFSSGDTKIVRKLLSKSKNISKKIFYRTKGKSIHSSSGKLSFSKPFEPQTITYISFLEHIFSNNQFSIVQVQYAHNLNLFSLLPENSIRIFELIELQFEVIKDYAETTDLNEYYKKYIKDNSEFLELTYMALYDSIFTLNEKDAEYLRKNIKKGSVFSSPFGVLSKDILKNPVFGIPPAKIVFSGGDAHFPNVDGLEWYLRNVHPLVIKKCNLNIHVTGQWSASSIKYFKSICPEIIFEGFIDNLSGFLKDSIMIVPIRIGGGGLRTKIIYAMANAAPVVTTSLGSFGISAEPDKHYCIGDSEVEFADAICKIHNNEIFRMELTKNAYSFLNANFSQNVTAMKRNEIYLNLLKEKNNSNNI